MTDGLFGSLCTKGSARKMPPNAATRKTTTTTAAKHAWGKGASGGA